MQKISHIDYTNIGHTGDAWAQTFIRVGYTGPVLQQVMFDVTQKFEDGRPNSDVHSNLSEEDCTALIYALRKARHEIRKVNRREAARQLLEEYAAADAADHENQYNQMLDEQQLAEDAQAYGA